MIIKEALVIGTKLLQTVGIDNGYLESSLLLAYILEMSREELLLNREENLPDNHYTSYQNLLAQRVEHKPLSHIIGKKYFWKHQFTVNNNVLDPRPDSETIIETTLKYRPDIESQYNIMDFGTGTGCLILSLLDEYKYANAVAVEKSYDAIKIAQKNAKNLNLNDRIKFINQSWNEDIDFQDRKFDIIISNPPYIPTDDIANLHDNVRNYEPHLALDGGEDGLDCYRTLIPIMKNIMSNGAICIVEIGINQENDLQNIIEENNLSVKDMCRDLAGVIRCIVFG